MKDTVTPLKPANKKPSQRARLVIEMGEHKGTASLEWWCGCFISTVKKLKRDERYRIGALCEEVTDAAIASGEYTAVHLTKVSHVVNNFYLIGERTEGNVTRYYELSGFESEHALSDLYTMTFKHPAKNFQPKFSRQWAEILIFIPSAVIILTLPAWSPQWLWLMLVFLVCVVAAYFIARTLDKQRHVVRMKSLALDTMPSATA